LHLRGDGARTRGELSKRSRLFLTVIAKKNVGHPVCALGRVLKKDIY
jgi:hypothetical protein